ncbi:hypothetical protein HAX54_009512 [Datura stramonium]|uniref:Uncharacterized protein n=1 Tax=Datura stramonium TaxID=4076 RepID=A0ABS8WY04_DATST|nr:hypothetical protein [Datura stramonium]
MSYGRRYDSSPFSFSNFNCTTAFSQTPPSPMRLGFSSSDSTSSSPVADDSVPRPSATAPSWLLGASFVSTDASTDTGTSTLPLTFPPELSSSVSSVSEKPCDSTTTPMYPGFSSSASSSLSSVTCDTVPGPSATAPSWLLEASWSSTAASTDTATMPWFTDASSSTMISASLGPTTNAKTTSLTVSPIPPSDSVSSSTSSSSVSAITTTLTARATSSLSGKASVSTYSQSQSQSTVSALEFATLPACCSLEQDEVAAILAGQCKKLLSCRTARQAQGIVQNERHVSVAQPRAFAATGFETTSSSKPVSDSAATAEQKYVPMTGAPSTFIPSVLLDSKSGSSLLPSSQPAEEEQTYFPPVELLHSTVNMWKWVIANKKTDQEVTEQGLRHFYEGINYFCLLSERLQVATDKYNEATKARDDMKKMNSSLKDKLAEASRKVEDSKKEKESLEHELAGAAYKITTLTGEKESILWVQTILHQTISKLRRELEEAGPAAIQKYKASSLYRQELMEYAAPYMGKGVKLAIEKIKAKDPTFDPEIYGLEMYILPPEADDQEFSSEEESDRGCQSRAE